MTNFIVELPKKQAHPVDHLGKQWWTLHVDEVFRLSASGVGLTLQSPIGELMEQAISLNFYVSNNKAEYEVG